MDTLQSSHIYSATKHGIQLNNTFVIFISLSLQ
jgi:hypothetical protein